MEYGMETLIDSMIRYDNGDPKRIHHFLKVHAFAYQIGKEEHLDPAALFTLETAAIVHDIGIRKAEEVYGSSAGPYQEELGPVIADEMLSGLGWPREVIDRVCYLVGHHHTYTGVNGIDYRILLEADALVNLYENNSPPQVQKQFYDHVFRTESGRQLCRILYPACQ